VTLVALAELDLDRHLSETWTWIRDPALRSMLGTASEPTLADHREWFDRQRTDARLWTRVIEADGVPVGVCGLHSIDHRSHVAEVWLHCSGRMRSGIGRQAMRLVLGSAFGELGLHRVRARVFGFNAAAKDFFRACGFVLEGTEREAILHGGRFHDTYVFGVLDREFEP